MCGYSLGMKKTLASLILIAPLMLTACGGDTTAKELHPDSWATLADMQKELDAITGDCHENVENDEASSGSCYNGEVLLTYGVTPEQSQGVKVASLDKDTGSEGYVVWDEDWAVYCAVAEGGNLDSARDMCQKISDAAPNSTWIDSEAKDKVGMSVESESAQADDSSESSVETGPIDSFRDGTFLVGTDIQPGTYRNGGTQACYWARLSGLSGTTDDILANDNPRGQSYVEILPSDKAFESKNCGTWELAQ